MVETCDSTPSGALLLEARHVVRQSAGHRLLHDVSLEIHAGDRVAIVGPTGSGKTLLLRAIALLDPLDAGSILWQGDLVRGDRVPEFRSRVMYLHQQPQLLEGTVESNLLQPFALRVHRDRRFNRERILSRLASLGRDKSFLEKKVRDLSGGELQITALLRAIQLDPDVLLLDEPTSALDSQAARTLENLLAAWLDEQSRQRAAVWVTHDRSQADRIADRVLQMTDGSLKQAN